MYGGFALIVIGLLLEDARRIDTVLRYYNILLVSFPAIFVGFCLTLFWVEYIPRLYGSVPIVDITTSAVGTHLAGTMVFALIGYRKVSFLWFLVWLTTLTIVAATNRGATLAVLGPVVFAMLMLGRLRLLLTAMLAVVASSPSSLRSRALSPKIMRRKARAPSQCAPGTQERREHCRGFRGAEC